MGPINAKTIEIKNECLLELYRKQKNFVKIQAQKTKLHSIFTRDSSIQSFNL